LGYSVDQPENIRHPEFVAKLKDIGLDFLVVVAFGQILSKAILDIPKHGAVNVHASLLPKYRGPAPIQWAILRGESVTGVTTMLMDPGVDTGDILLSAATPIESDDTASSLHDRLADMGAEVLIKTIRELESGTLFPRAQKHSEATYAPLLKKESGHIQWNQPALSLEAMIRALTPWPGAYCHLKKKRIKIYAAKAIAKEHDEEPGTILPGFPGELWIAAADTALSITEIQIESGKRMPIDEFLLGHPIAPGTKLT
jgi:methionyl-tRNA formyltransferase